MDNAAILEYLRTAARFREVAEAAGKMAERVSTAASAAAAQLDPNQNVQVGGITYGRTDSEWPSSHDIKRAAEDLQSAAHARDAAWRAVPQADRVLLVPPTRTGG